MSEASGQPGSAMSRAEALSWIADVFNEPVAHVRPEAARPDLPGWDSLGHLVLISALDQRFGIRLSQKELSSLTTVQSIFDVLARHNHLQSSDPQT